MANPILATKGSPGDILLQMLGGGGLMDYVQAGGQMPGPYDYFSDMGLMSPQGILSDQDAMNSAAALDELNQFDRMAQPFEPNDMSGAYAQPADATQMPMGQPDQGGLMALMKMIGASGYQQPERPGQAYMNQYIQSLMG